MRLWGAKSCAAWHDAAEQYVAVVRAQHVNGLEELDAWYRGELPEVVGARQPPYVTRSELGKVTVWKMKRGVWRERNRLLVLGNSGSEVKAATTEAFALVPDPRSPIALISRLAGVGPATASGVLAAYCPDIYPFFDELVADEIPELGKVSFTHPYYQRYAARLRERAEILNQECPHRRWTAHDLSQALWSASGGKVAHPK